MTSKHIAERLADEQKEISVAEFFERNKQILGFDSPTKSMITSVKEAVDNALDACEEANILPEMYVELRAMGDNEYRLIVEDNGPGIMRRQIPNVFGRLLYGSRFHAIRQSRGQQGIGISAVVMYGQNSSGKPAKIRSKVAHEDVAHEFELLINTKKNRADKIKDEPMVWPDKEHGTRIEIQMAGRVTKGKQSVSEYIRQTAIVNPHLSIVYKDPFKQTFNYERSSPQNPTMTTSIKPHPMGTELGTLRKMLKATKARTLTGFLHTEFSSVSHNKAKDICEKAGMNPERSPKRLSIEDSKEVLKAFDKVKLRSPDTSCLSPIGSRLIKLSLKNILDGQRPEYYAPPVTRPPKVANGNPFQVEAGIVFGGELTKDKQVEIMRFANRVPLLYQQGACAITRSLEAIDWRKYGLEQRGGKGIPIGPAIIFIHVASTKIPFTNEAKEAVANVQEIRDEVERALRDVGRKLKLHRSKSKRKGKVQEKFDIVQQILPEIAKKSAEILKKPVPDITKVMTKVMDIVQVKEHITYSKDNKLTTVKISVKNFRPTAQKLSLFAVLPLENLDTSSIDPKPSGKSNDGKYQWDMKRLLSNTEGVVSFNLKGLKKGEWDETEFYLEGVDLVHLLGADPLPGDWELDDGQIASVEQFLKVGNKGGQATFAFGEDDEKDEASEEELEEDDLGGKDSTNGGGGDE